MATTTPRERFLSFGDFRLDRRSGELFCEGRPVRLPPQPAKLLLLLVSSPGELVTREAIQKAPWADDTFVDFEQGIHKCIKQVRAALGDEVEEPVYIETVPRKGYRFLAKVDVEMAGFRSRRAYAVSGALVGLLSLGALAAWLVRPKAPPVDARLPRFQLTLPRGVGIPGLRAVVNVLAISPDGDRVAFVGCPRGVACQLYLRDPSEIDARPLPGTEEAVCPFFSPDGRWIGFGALGKLKKIDLEHGSVETLADAPQFRGGSWGEDGSILFSVGWTGLLRVSAEGGEVKEVTKPDPDEYSHRWPQILPGARAALFEVTYRGASGRTGSVSHDIAVVDLETGAKRILVESAGSPKYVNDHALFGRDGTLYAAPFDLERLDFTRAPLPVLEGVAMWSSPSQTFSNSGQVYYDIAGDGTLLFSPLEARLPRRTLVLVDRGGQKRPLSRSQRAYYDPLFSPDGRRIAVTVRTDIASRGAFIVDIESDA